MNRGKNVDEGSGHGRQRGDRHTACRTGTAGKHSRRTLHPAQASKQTNGPQLAGLAAKTTAADVGSRPLAVQVSGGSTVVLAAMKAGSDLPTSVLPHLTPLPVTVPTHSLNFENPI